MNDYFLAFRQHFLLYPSNILQHLVCTVIQEMFGLNFSSSTFYELLLKTGMTLSL